MKWLSKDLEQFVKAKEYIDTVIIPLIPMTFSNDETMIETAFQKEVMEIYTMNIEQKLKGRVFLLPEYYYLKNDTITEEQTRLEQYIDNIKQQPFKYIFLITFDRNWRKITKQLDVELLWIPSLSNENLQSNELQQMIQSQVKAIEELIKDSWNSH